MPEDRQPFDELLDLLVFAPLGLATMVQEQLPGLIGKGRERWATQATMAKVVGEFAVAQGRKEAAKAARRASGLVGQVVSQRSPRSGSGVPASSVDAEPSGAPAPASASAPDTPTGPSRPTSAEAADALAIPGYNALSAPQVVSRLDGLSGEELEAVRAYEERTRGRKTILGRVAQLQALLD
ncbi:MAG: hypothetical protein ACRDZW_07245 [Acidimicrobiales bacterium]